MSGLLFLSCLIVVNYCFSTINTVGISRGWPLVLIVIGAGYLIWRKFPSATWMTLTQRAYRQSVLDGDQDKEERLASELINELRRRAPAAAPVDFMQASLFAGRERYQEAVDAMAQLDTTSFSEAFRTLFLNNMAWCKAHLGQLEEASVLAEEAVRRAEAGDARFLGSCKGTLGTAHLLAGRPLEALPLLAEAAESHSATPSALTCNCYYLGQTYLKLNRIDEARSSFERAASAGPETRFGRRAITVLGKM